MKILEIAKTVVFSGALLGAPLALAQDAERNTSDILIDVLVRKGILSEEEAVAIRDEVETVAAAEQSHLVETTAAAVTSQVDIPSSGQIASVPMPKSLGAFKLYGDARFRFQGEEVEDASTRTRWRYRARFGADYDFRESPFSAGLRLETASANDSTNVNFGGFFDKTSDELRLGLLYLRYAGENVTVDLGKHKHPFHISSAFWDSDINPEGFSESFQIGDWKLNLGQYVIDDEREDRAGAGTDDFMFVGQAEWSNGEGLTAAPMLLATTNGASKFPEGASFGGENAITSFRDFFVVALPVEYAFEANGTKQKFFGTVGKNVKGGDAVDRLDSPYYSSLNTDDQDLFFNIGYQYGSAKAAGTWQAGIEYRYLEGASYTPNLSDSDFAKNGLNQQGFVFSYVYAVTDFLTTGIAYLDSRAIEDDYMAEVVANERAKILQVDASVKF